MKQGEAIPVLELDTLRRTALLLVAAGLLWNLLEAVVALWAGVETGSVAILAFGLDSIVELLAGAVLVWRLRTERDEEEAEAAESRARKLVGLTFFLLAVYIGIHSVANLLGAFPQPEPSLAGIGIVVASAVVMSVLYVGKMRIATRMQSRALRAEAMESLFCDLQDVGILVGLALNALFSWWWADPVSALLLIPLFIKEGRENFAGHHHGDEHEGHEDHFDGTNPAGFAGDREGHAPTVCFCRNCLFGLRACRAACCAA